MDNPKPPHSPPRLLDDLESIREFLLGSPGAKPQPLDSVDPRQIPLLSDVVPATAAHNPTLQPLQPPSPAPAQPPAPQVEPPRPAAQATVAPPVTASQPRSAQIGTEPPRLSGELRAAAQLILQDVLDDFVPQIEAELRRRLEARLDRLVAQRKG